MGDEDQKIIHAMNKAVAEAHHVRTLVEYNQPNIDVELLYAALKAYDKAKREHCDHVWGALSIDGGRLTTIGECLKCGADPRKVMLP